MTFQANVIEAARPVSVQDDDLPEAIEDAAHNFRHRYVTEISRSLRNDWHPGIGEANHIGDLTLPRKVANGLAATMRARQRRDHELPPVW